MEDREEYIKNVVEQYEMWKEAVSHTRELLASLPTEELQNTLDTQDVEINLERLMKNELKQRRRRERRMNEHL